MEEVQREKSRIETEMMNKKKKRKRKKTQRNAKKKGKEVHLFVVLFPIFDFMIIETSQLIDQLNCLVVTRFVLDMYVLCI